MQNPGASRRDPAEPAPAARCRDEYDAGNIKIAMRLAMGAATDEDLLLLRRLGVRWVHAEFGTDAPYESIRAAQERLGRFGLKISVGVMDAYRSLKIQLAQRGGDQETERFQTFLQDLGRLAIPAAKIDFHPANTYTTTMIETPRGYISREFSLEDFRRIESQAFEREYPAEEIWANYVYFIRAVLPVAEKADVRLALHPDDPPLAMMNGVAKVFVNYDGYLDMYRMVKALRQVGYAGSMVPDHIPALAGDRGMNRAGVASCITYMRALLRRANEEVG